MANTLMKNMIQIIWQMILKMSASYVLLLIGIVMLGGLAIPPFNDQGQALQRFSSKFQFSPSLKSD